MDSNHAQDFNQSAPRRRRRLTAESTTIQIQDDSVSNPLTQKEKNINESVIGQPTTTTQPFSTLVNPTRRRRRIIITSPQEKLSENTQIIDDDSLIRIFSFISPIPFFFSTLPLINKQLFQYFYNFVTSCPLEELNYFKELNFWDFGTSQTEPTNKEEITIAANHFKLLFGERGNIFFNILQKRILETSEIVYFPSWIKIGEHLINSQFLHCFQKLKTAVFPSSYQKAAEKRLIFFLIFLYFNSRMQKKITLI